MNQQHLLPYVCELGTQLRVNIEPNAPGDPDTALALVVAVNPDETVNIWVFDSAGVQHFRTNVPVFPSEAAARGDLADPATITSSAVVAWWAPGHVERAAARASGVEFFRDDWDDSAELAVTTGALGAASCDGGGAGFEFLHGYHVEGDATCTVDSLCTGTDGHQYAATEAEPDAAAEVNA